MKSITTQREAEGNTGLLGQPRSPTKELPRVQMLIKTEQRMVTSWSEKRDASPLLSWQLPPLPVSDALGRGGPGDRLRKFELDGAAL